MSAPEAQFTHIPWLKMGPVAAAALLLYSPMLVKLVSDWYHNSDNSHGFFIPPLAAYVAWRKGREPGSPEGRPSNGGMLIALVAVALLFVGSLGAELFLTRFSLVVMLSALVVFFYGWRWLRQMAFPLAMLLLMIPIPRIIFNQVLFDLQLTATRLASSCLSSVGVPVLREGNMIFLANNVTLEVAEACSGIRSVMALLALAVTYGYFLERRSSIRWILLLATVPIAVLANGLRIAGTGLLTFSIGEEAAEGFFHTFSGWLVFVYAVLVLFLLHRLLLLAMRALHWERGDDLVAS